MSKFQDKRNWPQRPLAGLVTLGLMGLLVLLDFAASEPIDPFAAPPPIALGSGLAPSGAHCTDL